MRDCLERATEADPASRPDYAALAEIVLQEHRRGLNPRAGDAPPLERALQAARRAVEIRPGSAHAHQALMDALFVRGEYALAIEAGERAVTLNPYDPSVLGCYGARLIALGEHGERRPLSARGREAGAVRPGWLDFFLFLAAYLADDHARRRDARVADHVRRQFRSALLARALVAAQHGKPALAREHLAQLGERQPPWREDCRARSASCSRPRRSRSG